MWLLSGRAVATQGCQVVADVDQRGRDLAEPAPEAGHTGIEEAAGLAEPAGGEAGEAAEGGQQQVDLHEDVAAFAQLIHKEEPALTPAPAPGNSSAVKRQRQALCDVPASAEDALDDSDVEDEEDQFSDLSIDERQALHLLMKHHKPDRAQLLRLLQRLRANVRWRHCQDLDDYLQRFEVHAVLPRLLIEESAGYKCSLAGAVRLCCNIDGIRPLPSNATPAYAGKGVGGGPSVDTVRTDTECAAPQAALGRPGRACTSSKR